MRWEEGFHWRADTGIQNVGSYTLRRRNNFNIWIRKNSYSNNIRITIDLRFCRFFPLFTYDKSLVFLKTAYFLTDIQLINLMSNFKEATLTWSWDSSILEPEPWHTCDGSVDILTKLKNSLWLPWNKARR